MLNQGTSCFAVFGSRSMMTMSVLPFSLDVPAELPTIWLRALWDQQWQRNRHRGARREVSMLLLPHKFVGSGGTTGGGNAFAARVPDWYHGGGKQGRWWPAVDFPSLRGQKSLGASRNLSHCLYFTFRGRFMLFKEESFDTASKEPNLQILIVAVCLFFSVFIWSFLLSSSGESSNDV